MYEEPDFTSSTQLNTHHLVTTLALITMVAHLLEGDLASNHLSWQWVASTGSIKPYLFNADNVAQYAEAPWHSPRTVIDAIYEALHALAHQPQDCGPEPVYIQVWSHPPCKSLRPRVFFQRLIRKPSPGGISGWFIPGPGAPCPYPSRHPHLPNRRSVAAHFRLIGRECNDAQFKKAYSSSDCGFSKPLNRQRAALFNQNIDSLNHSIFRKAEPRRRLKFARRGWQ